MGIDSTNKPIQLRIYQLLAMSSLSMTLFMAFIDEGNYNFSWVYDAGSWGALVFYISAIFAIHLLIFKVILGKYPMVGKVFSYITISLVVGLMIAIGIVF